MSLAASFRVYLFDDLEKSNRWAELQKAWQEERELQDNIVALRRVITGMERASIEKDLKVAAMNARIANMPRICLWIESLRNYFKRG